MNNSVTPVVSVVIPSYNHGQYLIHALQSVCNQSYPHWEVIVIDNHSTDNTDDVLATYCDSRIAHYKIHNNGVIASSRNAGIRRARGEFIAFLDSDDMWDDNKLSTCLAAFNNNVDLVYHDLRIVSQRSRKFYQSRLCSSRQVYKPVLIDLLVNGNAIANSSVLIRKQLLDRVGYLDENIEIVGCEDYKLWLQISEISSNFVHLPLCLGSYRIHPQGVSKTDLSKPLLQVVSPFFSLLDNNQLSKLKVRISFTSAIFNLKSGFFLASFPELCFVFRYGNLPYRIKSVLLILLAYFRFPFS